MATIFKRKGSRYWWITLTTPNKKVLRFSTKTSDKKLAQKLLYSYEGKIAVAQLYQASKLDDYQIISNTSVNKYEDARWIVNRWSAFNAKERLAVLYSYYKGRCVYCKREVRIPERRKKYSEPDRCVIDHRIPHVAGGSDAFDNLVLACADCNKKKADRSYDDFIQEVLSLSIEQQISNAP